MNNIGQTLARFAVETKWEDLPADIVQETKRIIMENIGCALGALSTDKGKMMAALGRRYGGPPESSIIGLGNKVSCSSAALTNGELFLTLDYSNIIAGGHDGVYVFPTVLAIAESVGASGKDLILTTAIGLEISARLARAVGRHNITPEDIKRQQSAQRGITGNAYSNFGAAAGAGRLLKLDEEKMLHAMGIAGHLCMVLSYGRWGPSGFIGYMAKYGVPGWQSTGAVTAVLLAEMGYTGDTMVLDDPERGFCFYVGYPNWYPDEITNGLGKNWCFNIRILYKPYPCCGVLHGTLDCFCNIIEQNNLMPDEIESVRVFGRGGMMVPPRADSPSPATREMKSISAAQFNLPYNIAVAAHRIARGAEWSDPGTMNNPKILQFMDKVTAQEDADYMNRYMKETGRNLLAIPAKVEVVARGKTFTEERTYHQGTSGTDVSWTDKEVVEKFRHNAERILTKNKIEKAVEDLTNLEKIDNISQLMRHVTL
jgi:2-methylcitrate dehydratase PrpD